MLEANGDLWGFNGVHVITTNGYVRRDGAAVMGRGCARQAAVRYPRLPMVLGEALKEMGNQVYYFYEYNIITFPVKHLWSEPAVPGLIIKSAKELMNTIARHSIIENLYLARPGTGNGQLLWVDVKPLIKDILSDQVTAVDF